MKKLLIFLLLFVSISNANASDKKTFVSGYADAVWSNQYGASSFQQVNYGIRDKNQDYFLSLKNEWSDTSSGNVPWNYTLSGISAGGGIRCWDKNKNAYLSISYARGLTANRKGDDDFRVGGAGYWYHENQRNFKETYAEAFWISIQKDTLGMIRYRDGKIISDRDGKKTSLYGIGELHLSGSGDNAADNRLEAGVGISYRPIPNAILALDVKGSKRIQGSGESSEIVFNPTITTAFSF